MNKPQKITLAIAAGAAIIATGLVIAVAKTAVAQTTYLPSIIKQPGNGVIADKAIENDWLPAIEFREGCISPSYTYRQTTVLMQRRRPCLHESTNYWDKNQHPDDIGPKRLEFRAPDVDSVPPVPNSIDDVR